MSSYGLWLSAAGMKVNQHRQTLLANNMANANTTGFKHDLAVVTQRQVESQSSPTGMSYVHPVLDGLAGGVNVRPTYHSFAQGPITWTGNPLDVAIRGDGFFSVSDGEATRYTRDGEFTVNTHGELVLTAGEGCWKVLDDHGAPIVVDETAGPLSVSEDGTVRQGRTAVGNLGLMTTENKSAPGGLRKVGGNLFDAGSAEMVPISGEFVPESKEGSNFEIMEGLASMIEAARAYQLNATMVQLQDQLTGQAVNTVGRLA
jgi:flagellar basal body rod protein FlgG